MRITLANRVNLLVIAVASATLRGYTVAGENYCDPHHPLFCMLCDCHSMLAGATVTACDHDSDRNQKDCCEAKTNLWKCHNYRCFNCKPANWWDDNVDCRLATHWGKSAYENCERSCAKLSYLPELYHKGCDNDLLCACHDAWWSGMWGCKYNDWECRCPAFADYVECIRPQVETCNSKSLNDWSKKLVGIVKDKNCDKIHAPDPIVPPADNETGEDEAAGLIPGDDPGLNPEGNSFPSLNETFGSSSEPVFEVNESISHTNSIDEDVDTADADIEEDVSTNTETVLYANVAEDSSRSSTNQPGIIVSMVLAFAFAL